MESDVFKQIIMDNYEAMYRTAWLMLRERSDAMDAVHDTVTALWDRRDTISHTPNPSAYAIQSVRNRCIDMIRYRRSLEYRDITDNHADETATSYESQPEPDAGEILTRLIGQLPPRQQQVLSMKAAGCDTDLIATATGLTTANVRQLLSRTRRKLKEMYDNEF